MLAAQRTASITLANSASMPSPAVLTMRPWYPAVVGFHRRAPGVEHGGEADAGTEVLGIGGDGEQRLRCRAEQQVVDHRLVLVGDRGDLDRQREDQVKVAHREQIGLAGGEPVPRRRALTLGAMTVAAWVV